MDNNNDNDDGVPMIVVNTDAFKSTGNIIKDQTEWSRVIIFLFLVASTLIFLGLWLAESQFSHGILRKRYIDEPCSSNDTCVDGFYCDLLKRCQKIPCSSVPFDPDRIFNSSFNCPNKTCPACPTCPPQSIHKILSYYDFNEFPNYWIDPGPQGFYDHNYNMQYGACKEVCARDSDCHGICYNGFAKICWQMGRYYPMPFTPIYNTTYTCAMKTFN